MGETYRLEYENSLRDEAPSHPGQGYLQIAPTEFGFDERRAPGFASLVKEKFLVLKRLSYYLAYSSLSWFSASMSGERSGDRIYRSFIYGQLVGVVSAAIWWGFFGTVITFMMESDTAAGNARLIFNLMLVIMSPISRVISESLPMRNILVYVTLLRSFIWCSYLPFVYFVGRYFGYKLIWEIVGNFQFYTIIALDGAIISLLNVVDLDCGGLNYLSNQYEIEITTAQKSKAVYTHLTIFDFSFMMLNPILAFSILVLVSWYNSLQESNVALAAGAKLGKCSSFDFGHSGIEIPILVIVSVFQALSTVSVFFYRFGIPVTKEFGSKTSEDSGEYYININQERAQKAFENERSVTDSSSVLNFNEIYSKLSSFSEGLMLINQDFNVRNRILCLALETALEDAMTSIIIPLTIINISKDLVARYSLGAQDGTISYWASLSLLLVSITLGVGKLSSFTITWKYKKEYIHNRDFEFNANNEFESGFSTNNHTASSESISSDMYSKFIDKFLSESNLNKLFMQISIADVSVLLLPTSISIMKIYPDFFFIQITCKLSTRMHVPHVCQMARTFGRKGLSTSFQVFLRFLCFLLFFWDVIRFQR